MSPQQAAPRSLNGVPLEPAKQPPTSIGAAAPVVVLALLAGCAGDAGPNPAGAGGSAAGSTSSGGVGGIGSAGQNSAGGSSAAGMGAAGISGGGAGGLGGSSSSGGSSGGDSIPPTFATVKLVLEGGGPIMPCSAAPCHGVNGMAPPGDPLELPPTDDQQLYTNLTSYTSKACNNTKLVTPGNPAQSALLTILQGPCGMTPRMPYMCSEQDGTCIPDEYIAALEQWIASGAPRQ